MRKSIYCIGTRIRERRKEKGWTQKDLAQRIGTSYKYISHVENGVKFPSLEMLICLARELDVSLDYLISSEEIGDDVKGEAVTRMLLSGCSPEEEALFADVIVSIRNGLKKYGFQTGLNDG